MEQLRASASMGPRDSATGLEDGTGEGAGAAGSENGFDEGLHRGIEFAHGENGQGGTPAAEAIVLRAAPLDLEEEARETASPSPRKTPIRPSWMAIHRTHAASNGNETGPAWMPAPCAGRRMATAWINPRAEA